MDRGLQSASEIQQNLTPFAMPPRPKLPLFLHAMIVLLSLVVITMVLIQQSHEIEEIKQLGRQSRGAIKMSHDAGPVPPLVLCYASLVALIHFSRLIYIFLVRKNQV